MIPIFQIGHLKPQNPILGSEGKVCRHLACFTVLGSEQNLVSILYKTKCVTTQISAYKFIS